MKKIKFSIIILFAGLLFTSCLKSNLDDLPEFEDSNIVSVQRVEYRFTSGDISAASNQNIVKFITLGKTAKIDATAKTVTIDVTVPAATTSFPETERAKCAVNNIAVLLQVSTAARIAPESGSPELGIPGDWTSPHKYVVTAADGSKTEWTVSISSFSK
jgi:hypothetical protein